MAERQGPSLGDLKAREQKLQQSLVKAELVRATIGGPNFGRHLQQAGKNGVERIETDIRVGDIRNALETRAIPHLTSQLETTQSQIDHLETEVPRLISLFHEYRDEVSRVRGYVNRIKTHVRSGRLDRSSLVNAQAVWRDLQARGQDPEIIRGREFFEAAQKAQKEKARKAKEVLPPKVEAVTEGAFVFPDDREVSNLTAKERQILSRLHFSEDEALPNSDLAISVYGKQVPIKTSRNRISAWMRLINRKLRPIGWQVVNPTLADRRGREAKYYLAPVVEKKEGLAEEKPKLVFLEEPNEVIFARRVLKLTVKQFNILEVLARNLNQRVLSRDLLTEALGEPDPRKMKLRNYIRRLRQIFNQPDRPEFLVSEMRASRSWYMLRDIEVVWPEEPKIKERRDIMPPPWPTRITALNFLMDNPEASTKEVTDILGRRRDDRDLTWMQAFWALRKAVNLMHIRDSVRRATQEEVEMLAKIDQFVKDNDLVDLAGFKSWLKFRLAPTRREAKIAEIVPAPFSLEEAAILATEISYRRQILGKYEIEPIDKNIVGELVRQMPKRFKLSEEELFKLRSDALCKMIQIVQKNLIDEVYDQQTSEAVRDFLVYFLVLDPPKTYDLLQELLAIPLVQYHQDDSYGIVTKIWQELEHQPAVQLEEEVISEAAEPAVAVVTEEAQPSKVVKEKVIKPPALSQEDRQFLNRCLEKIRSNRITRPINGAQLTKFFPTLKMRIQRRMLDNGYVSPDRDRSSHPRYSQLDILVMLLVVEKGNNLRPQEVRRLRGLISQWLEKKNSNQGK